MEPPAECQQETPTLTEAAAEFLRRIGPGELERCLFAETLEGVAARDRARARWPGQWWLVARWAPYERAGEPARRCLLVRAGSRGRQDGVPSSGTLKAYVTPQLETLEQEELERLELQAQPVERRTHIVSHQHGITVTKSLQEGERSLGVQWQAVGSAEAEVFVIERAMHTITGVSTTWHSSFLPNGRLARLEQVGCPMLVFLQDESVLSETGRGEPRPLFPKQPLDWEEDIQLRSWFLDRKEELQASHAAYIHRHPELWVLLADFLQALLLQQPHDPVSFAAQFFAPQEPPSSLFASSGAANPLPSPPPPHPPANGE
ncbi:ciliogenesis-associated TTC17-interacting protein isoform X2 [Tyto alba]|uniref:ciliogenesis-associated TTC17-interacting protein isoform X2 n=1 Tax=Tyto alba TaxID=56313 RepID=UPI001C682ECC|nr:ciliogenesis-associated TTC17-interacting protein isoform X2 [Tyto alba]